MAVAGVVLDIGNVIVRWDPARLYKSYFSDPAECDRFLGEVCTMAWHTEHDRGVSMADNAIPLIAQYPHYREAIEAWNTRWDDMFDGCIDQTVAAIEALHQRGVPLFALTNMPSEKAAGVFAMSPAFDRFRDIIISGDEGLVKPDPEIFALTCRRCGMAPQQLLFVDDNLANIEAAKALGFVTHRFADPDALWPDLVANGLV